jgi:hypothetical protein
VPPLRNEALTFRPDKVASIFGPKHSDNFGVCGSLDRRGTRLYLWDEFIRQRAEVRVQQFAGYEVAVTRGESCHLRILDTYQAAVSFDLSSLPSSAVVSAELRINRRFSPLDPPRPRGTNEQCTVMLAGAATEAWAPGVYPSNLTTASAGDFRPFIASRAARPDAGPYNAVGTSTMRLNVTNTVGDWARGVRPNNGFVITPDLERVLDTYRHMDQGGFMCDMGITSFELAVTVAVPDR